MKMHRPNNINRVGSPIKDKEKFHRINLHDEDNFEQIELQIVKDDTVSKDDFSELPSFQVNPRRIGNTYAFLYNQEGEPLIVIGPHWPFFVCSYSLFWLVGFIFFYFLWSSLNIITGLVGIVIFVTQSSFYLFTFLRNPGLPKKNISITSDLLQNNNIKICDKCHYVIDPMEKTKHCNDCNVCIVGYDHHCPWTSKCIGKGNVIAFYAFLGLTFILLGYLFLAGTTLRLM